MPYDILKPDYDNASMIINNLISCEHYHKDKNNKDSELIPFLNDVSFAVENNDLLGIGAGNPEELRILIEVLGNMRPYYKGYVKLSRLGVRTTKRMVMENLFYVDSEKMVYEDMTLLEHLMLNAVMNSGSNKINYGELQKEILDIIVDTGMEDLVNSRIRYLTKTTRMVIAIFIACMSRSEKIVINAIDYVFAQADVERLHKIFDFFKSKGKTIVIASMEPKVIGMCCDKVVYISHGRVEVYCTVNDLYKRWDKVVCSIKSDDNQKLGEILKNKIPGLVPIIINRILYLKNYSNKDIKNKEIYDLAVLQGIHIEFIRFNRGRVENAFDEIKETFNDIYK